MAANGSVHQSATYCAACMDVTGVSGAPSADERPQSEDLQGFRGARGSSITGWHISPPADRRRDGQTGRVDRGFFIIVDARQQREVHPGPKLAERFRVPLLAKDTIKDAIMVVLSSADVDSSRQVGRAAVEVMLALAPTLSDCPVEAPRSGSGQEGASPRWAPGGPALVRRSATC